MNLELIPVSNSGITIEKDYYVYDARKDGKVAAVGFINQGTNISVLIEYPGVKIVLLPSEFHSIPAPVFGHDVTQYKITQSVINGALASSMRLKLSIQKYEV